MVSELGRRNSSFLVILNRVSLIRKLVTHITEELRSKTDEANPGIHNNRKLLSSLTSKNTGRRRSSQKKDYGERKCGELEPWKRCNPDET